MVSPSKPDMYNGQTERTYQSEKPKRHRVKSPWHSSYLLKYEHVSGIPLLPAQLTLLYIHLTNKRSFRLARSTLLFLDGYIRDLYTPRDGQGKALVISVQYDGKYALNALFGRKWR